MSRVKEPVQSFALPPELHVQVSAEPLHEQTHRAERHALEVGAFEAGYEFTRHA